MQSKLAALEAENTVLAISLLVCGLGLGIRPARRTQESISGYRAAIALIHTLLPFFPKLCTPTCCIPGLSPVVLCVSSAQALKATQDSLTTRIEGLESRCPASAGGRRAYSPCGVFIPEATVGTHCVIASAMLLASACIPPFPPYFALALSYTKRPRRAVSVTFLFSFAHARSTPFSASKTPSSFNCARSACHCAGSTDLVFSRPSLTVPRRHARSQDGAASAHIRGRFHGGRADKVQRLCGQSCRCQHCRCFN